MGEDQEWRDIKCYRTWGTRVTEETRNRDGVEEPEEATRSVHDKCANLNMSERCRVGDRSLGWPKTRVVAIKRMA